MPRPTEQKALATTARRPASDVPAAVLLACLTAAYAAGDRHGVRLLVHVIARREEDG
ncbi:hypothetical protein [Streptomyces dysideae]|uniref:hypothetical protein n=1 Tax=Streptomyces dysideae TaxID=909626 RepID=UPI001F2BECD9|nr:hypothetical protein [Streptomyces dysideae]